MLAFHVVCDIDFIVITGNIPKIVILRYTGILPHTFTITFAGQTNVDRYTGKIVIPKMVKLGFHCTNIRTPFFVDTISNRRDTSTVTSNDVAFLSLIVIVLQSSSFVLVAWLSIVLSCWLLLSLLFDEQIRELLLAATGRSPVNSALHTSLDIALQITSE